MSKRTTKSQRTAAQRIRKWWREWRLEFVIFGCGFIALNSIFIAEAFREGTTVDRTAAGQLGDFVGGYIGTYFALVTVVLVIKTLKEQRRSGESEKFETKYFELIKIHRDNVTEMRLQTIPGRRIFVLLLAEFRRILQIVQRIAEEQGQELSQRERLHVTYYCLFYGVGTNSSRMLDSSLVNFKRPFVQALITKLQQPQVVHAAQKELKLDYKPFDGHQSRLGHYYRHLYQAVSFVHSAKHLDDDDKYQHVKTIRAQLSTHEQALLLMNSLTPLGRVWWQYELILTYGLVKNLPRDFFESSTEIDTERLFPPGYFEWEEVNDETYLPADVAVSSEAK